MKSLRAIIVDDEPLARERLRRMLSSHDDEIAVVRECRTGKEAVDSILNDDVDLVFLDIQMPEINGFEVIERIGPDRMPAVVFTTAYDEHALHAFEVHALDYLLKPFDAARFDASLARAVKLVRGADVADLQRRLAELVSAPTSRKRYLDRVLIKSRARVYFVQMDEVDWIEAARNYVHLHVGPQSHLLRQTLSGIEEQLDPRRFLRIHRSAIVNLDRIRDMRPLFNGEYEVRLETGAVLTLTRTYKDQLEQFLPR